MPIETLLLMVRPYTMVEDNRLQNLYWLCEQTAGAGIPGAVVECGVCDGGSAAVLGASALNGRELWLFDTFEGIPEPGPLDGEFARGYSGTMKGSVEIVEKLIARTGFAPERLFLRKGNFSEAFCENLPETIAFLHIDCDWYESVLLCLETLYGRVSAGGVVVLDDFGYWEGARRAFYRFCQTRQVEPLLERVGATQAWWVKGRENNR